jgi:tetratricopeptide (TPR) repeat protein
LLDGAGFYGAVQAFLVVNCVGQVVFGLRRVLMSARVSSVLGFIMPMMLMAFLASVPAFGQESMMESRFRHGTEAMRNGSFEEAAQDFLAVIHTSPRFAEAYLNLGLVREQQGKYENAIQSLQQALRLKPALRGANLFLGIAQYRLNHYDQAIAALEREAKANPSDAQAWMWLGVTQLAAEKPEDAVLALDTAAKLAPSDVDILYHRGHAHMLVSKESYERMFHADPHSLRVHQVLAQADAEAGRDQDAIAEYQAALKIAPDQPGLHEALGTEYWKTGKLDEAEAEYQQELTLDPRSILATYKLGSLLVERAKAQEGKPLLEAALRQNPNLRNAYYYLGRAEMQLGNDEAAVANLKRAVSADTDPEIIQQAYYQLAQLYRRMHKAEESQAALVQFQKLRQEATEHQQQLFEKKRKTQEQGVADPPVPSNDPN